MTFLFVCGGSAGHINPAIAIAEQLRKKCPEINILFTGADKILEKRLVPAAGFDLVNIKMSGLRRGFSPQDIIHNIKTAKNLITANYRSSKLLKKYKPGAVIGTGGYVCYPVLKKASKFGIPTFILEPNAYPGLTVRLLSKIVDRVFVTYPGLEDRYSHPERVVYTGTPLKSEFFINRDNAEKSVLKEDKKPLVISYWGSLGATGMNIKILDFIKRNLEENKFNHIHATGVSGSADEMCNRLKELGIKEVKPPEADIREYINDMPDVMKAADIVISRAGASTVAELTALGKPCILIPSPNVTENHQEENAKQLQLAGGAEMILEKDCTGEVLFKTVEELLDNKEKLEAMANAQKSLSIPNAAGIIIDKVLAYCGDMHVKGEADNGREH